MSLAPCRLLLPACLLLTAGSLVAAERLPANPESDRPDPAEIEPPRLLEFVNADYPEQARSEGLEGAVALSVVVSAEGAATEVQVVEPAGHGFDEAAVAAVSRFRFEPARYRGEPIPVRIGYTYRFQLEKREVKIEPGQRVCGSVKERGTGLPVVGAEVSLAGRARTTTDGKGAFSLREIEPGSYQLHVSHSEYRPMELAVEVSEGKQLEVALLLEALVESPYEVVVRGKKEELVVTRYVLEQRTLETVPGTFGDPIRVVETLPGVARAAYGAGYLIIRGAMPEDSNVYVDGVVVPLLYHFFGGPSVLNPNFLDSIEYYPGNYPSRYGDAIAGIVDIAPVREKVEVWNGELDINMINASAFLAGPVTEDTGFRVGARRSYVDGVLAAAMALADEESVVVAPRFWDMQAQLYHDLNSRNRLSLFWLGSHDAMDLVTSAPEEEEEEMDINLSTRQDFHRVILNWRHVGRNWSLNVKPWYGFDGMVFDTPGIDLDIDVHWLAARVEAEFKPLDWLTINPGIEGGAALADMVGQIPKPRDYYIPGEEVSGVGHSRSEEVFPAQIGDDYWEVAGHLDVALEPLAGVTLVPGFRGAVFRHSGGFLYPWDPRLVARWQVGGGVTIKGGVGRFSMPPEPQYTDETYGNPDLDNQWAMQYSGGLEWNIGGLVNIDLVGFFVRRYDLAMYVQGVVEDESGEGVKPLYTSNDGWGRTLGMELMVKLTSSDRFYGWLAYTLSRTDLAGFFAELDETGKAKTDELNLSPFDQTHILSVVGSARLGRGWETGLRVRLVSGNPTTPFLGGRYIGDSDYYLPISGTAFSTRLSPFFQLDARVEKKWTFESWILSLYLDVQNITNHANTEFQVWDYRFRKDWNVPGIPFFPSLGIGGKF